MLYQFPVAAITNYNRLCGFKQLEFILLQFWRPRSQNKLHLVKVRMLAELVLSGGSRGRIRFLALSSF